MKIRAVEPLLLSVPFTDGSPGVGIMPTAWTELDFLLVRIEADNGLVGWGEGFGYFCNESVAATLRRNIIPLIIGREVRDVPLLMEEIQRRMVLQGRHGISTFAQSAVDIALWDLAAKSEQVSLATLLADSSKKLRRQVPAYASLVRYGDPNLVASYSEKAVAEGFSEIKLHEITLPEIRACRRAIGSNVPMIVDVNCNWSEAFTREVIPELTELRTRWLEEPIFPPEDYRSLAELRKLGMPIATGENACTAMPFEEIMRLGAADFLQPSITKIGGVTEFQKTCRTNAGSVALPLMPHSPYFGPGYLATLQMAAIEPMFELFEYLYVEPESWLFADMPLPHAGCIAIPDGPGLGLDPDVETLQKYTKPL